MPESNLARAEITRSVIGAFFTVYNRLGHGFVESSYAEALGAELTSRGHHVAREYATRVYYRGVEIGFHRLDMVVDLKVVVELKSTPVLAPWARRQLYNYLRATNLEVGLLLHFGPKPKFQRLYVPNHGTRRDPPPDGLPTSAGSSPPPPIPVDDDDFLEPPDWGVGSRR